MRKLKALIRLLIYLSLAPIIIFVLLYIGVALLIIKGLAWTYDKPVNCLEYFFSVYLFTLHDPIAKYISELIND